IVRAGLLLHDGPLVVLAFLLLVQILDQLRPLDAGFSLDQTAFAIETENTLQTAGVNQDRVIGELLGTHGMPATRQRNNFPRVPRVTNDAAALVEGRRGEELLNHGGIQLGMNVIDLDSAERRRARAGKSRIRLLFRCASAKPEASPGC